MRTKRTGAPEGSLTSWGDSVTVWLREYPNSSIWPCTVTPSSVSITRCQKHQQCTRKSKCNDKGAHLRERGDHQPLVHTHTPKVVCWLARFPRIRERRAIQAGLGATYSGLLDRVKLHHSHAVLAHEHLHLKCQVKPSSECECEHLCGASACMCTCVRVCVLCLFHTSACARLGTLIGLP